MRTPTKTFLAWLRLQNERNDSIGDLARDVLADSLRGESSDDVQRRLEEVGAWEGATEAFERARREYAQS